MASVEVTVAPLTTTPIGVWLTDVKDELRITSTNSDTPLKRLLKKAYFWAERTTGRRLLNQTLTTQFDADESRSPLYLPGHVIRSVTSVTTYDADDVATVVPTADYRLDGKTAASNFVLGGRLVAVQSAGWEPGRTVYAVSVVYVCGYGTGATDIPEDITDAIVRRAATAFRHPTDDAVEMPKAERSPVLTANEILWPYRVEV